MSRFGYTHRRRVSRLVPALALCLGAACGSGATEGPDDDARRDDRGDTDGRTEGEGGSAGNGSNGGTGGDRDHGGDEYSWGLPGGDLSVDSIGDVFNSLRSGDCAGAGSKIEGFVVGDDAWSPTQSRLYRAAIAACAGDRQAAREILGDGGITAHPGDCRLYKAIWSVLDQRPQESVTCPAPEDPRPPSSEETTSSSETDGSTSETIPTDTSAGSETSSTDSGRDGAG